MSNDNKISHISTTIEWMYRDYKYVHCMLITDNGSISLHNIKRSTTQVFISEDYTSNMYMISMAICLD